MGVVRKKRERGGRWSFEKELNGKRKNGNIVVINIFFLIIRIDYDDQHLNEWLITIIITIIMMEWKQEGKEDFSFIQIHSWSVIPNCSFDCNLPRMMLAVKTLLLLW